MTRITATILRRFTVHPPVKLKRSLRDNESGGTATPLIQEEAVEAAAETSAAEAAVEPATEAAAEEEVVVAARVAPSAASCWRQSAWNC